MASQTVVDPFKNLGDEFELGPKVMSWLTSPDGLAAKKLDDLLYACNEDGIDKLIDAAKPTNKLLAGSRLHQAWRSLKRAIARTLSSAQVTTSLVWMTCWQPQS